MFAIAVLDDAYRRGPGHVDGLLEKDPTWTISVEGRVITQTILFQNAKECQGENERYVRVKHRNGKETRLVFCARTGTVGTA
jgi:hypothetical protein